MRFVGWCAYCYVKSSGITSFLSLRCMRGRFLYARQSILCAVMDRIFSCVCVIHSWVVGATGSFCYWSQGIGNVTAALQAKGMLENTVIVFTADNGGPTTTGDGVGARNWPMRGGKHSIWEGGVRVTGVLSGAPVAAHAMGKTYTGLMHAADWLPTLADAAGVSLPANDSGLQNLDGVSQWAAITSIGNPDAGLWSPPPRSGLVIGNSTNECTWSGLNQRITERSDPLVAAGAVGCGFSIVKQQNQSLFKLIKGYGGGPDTWCNSSKGGADCVTPPPARGVSFQDSSACTVAPGVCFPGDDIKHVPSNTTDGSDCCDVCMSTPVR